LIKNFSPNSKVCEIDSKVGATLDARRNDKKSTKTGSKKIDKLSSLQKLFKWMNRMKNKWSDFPVLEEGNQNPENILDSCKNDQASLGEGKR
jgi:hypothetical protein